MQIVQFGLHFHGRTQMPHGEARIIRKDLARIELVLWVEEVLDLLKDAIEFTVLRSQKGGSRQTEAMFTADGTADRKGRVVEVSRQCLKARAIV